VGLPEHFEELFGTPHGLDLGPVITALGASYRLVHPGQVGAAVAASIRQPGLKVVAVHTDRARDAELHRAAFAAVRDALQRLVGGQP
jgi:2-succinyl-5-enolpyruvyl-6-hydroxy-3-cyclohexene-1-carboxylate synthase